MIQSFLALGERTGREVDTSVAESSYSGKMKSPSKKGTLRFHVPEGRGIRSLANNIDTMECFKWAFGNQAGRILEIVSCKI